MEQVKYYLPKIKVICTSEYCRKGEVATIVSLETEYDNAVTIQYADGCLDTARIGHANQYDLEFVYSQDELLQVAIEKYQGATFTSLAGTEFENFQANNAMWANDSKTEMYLNRKNDDGTALVYELGQWAALKSPESVPQPKVEDTFPIEGQCTSFTPELVAHLRKTRTPEGDQSLKERAKSVCWNNKGYWYVSRSSSKLNYKYSYLEQFFTQKTEEKPKMEPQEFDYTPPQAHGGFQLTLPPEIVGAALQQATQTHFRESEKKFEKHRSDVLALVDQKKQMIETELYQKFERTLSCDFVEFKTKVVEDYLTSKQIVIELGQDKKYEFSLEDKHEQLPKMVTFLQLFKQAMIVGPSGSGKSTMAKQAAEVMGLRYGAFSCNLEASKSELVGFANIDGYVESSFLDFYENGGVFLVDEYDSMSPSIAVVLNAAFDRTGMIAVPNRKGKTTAKKHKDFYCILAGNTWGSGSVEYQGREMQDAAFLDRFKMCRIFIDYDPQLEKNIAGKYYKFFTKVRNYITKKVDGENFSTRSIYDATMLLNNGFAEKDILTMMSEHWDDALRRDLFKTVGVEYPIAA
jgi:energy-coupling factor transporter ATP-binding protein EcfA2